MTTASTPFENPVKTALRAGKPIVGFNVFECLRPSVAKILAQTGYDFVLVDRVAQGRRERRPAAREQMGRRSRGGGRPS